MSTDSRIPTNVDGSASNRAPRRRRRARHLLAAFVLVAAMSGAGGAAYAYFTTVGTGHGSATVGTALGVTVEAATGTVSSELIPGASADLTLTLTNPNAFAVRITSIQQNGSVTAVGGVGTCTTSGVTVPTNNSLSVALASGSHVVVHVPNGVQMSTASESGCQGASFQIPVLITVRTP